MTGYLYVIELGSRIKVGQSMTPTTRLEAHRTQARIYDVAPGRWWVSAKGVGTWGKESVLLRWCVSQAEAQVAREYFYGLDFDEVVAFAKTIRPLDGFAKPPSQPLDDLFVGAVSSTEQQMSKQEAAA